MLDTLKRHWPAYLMEAAGLACFVITAGLLTAALEHPASPLHRAMGDSKVWRRVPLALAMGGVIAGLVYSPWGRRSGAHINPAVTWAFFRLGRIAPWDAVFYTVAQFAGAIGAAYLAAAIVGPPFAHPMVRYGVTVPGPHGPAAAFAGEFAISFVLMLALLMAIGSRRLEHHAGWIAGALIAVFLIVEAPLSGMSLNPARTFGSALVSRTWTALWVYFTAPPLAALTAAEVYRHMCRAGAAVCGQPVPHYPLNPAE